MIAILMATYNGEKYIEEQMRSILNNSYTETILYVCDDGSSDHTLQIAKRVGDEYPGRVVLWPNKQNKGVIRNFLSAAKDIEADYYMFSDQDDVWNRDKIEVSMQRMTMMETSYPEKPIVVFGDAQVVDAKLREISPSFHKQTNLNCSKLSLKDICMENKLMGCTILFNHSLKERITDMPDDVHMHDWWIALIGAAFGYISYIDQPLLKYRQHGDNTVGSMSELAYICQNITKLGEQRKLLYDIFRQAGAFLECYRQTLSHEQVEMLTVFSELPQENWMKRRYNFLHYGFRKTGLLRNFGVLVIL